ncbi:MAG: PilN domain-containing protein [Vampirovibrionales bacterium]|nr:PilN domain-containing protein [Vampirovibrionales bacterium]
MASKTSSLCKVGLSIFRDSVEAAIFSDSTPGIIRSVRFPAMSPILDETGDGLISADELKDATQSVLNLLGQRVGAVHLSVPACLLTLGGVAKVPPKMLKLAVENEAERFEVFQETPPAVGYALQGHIEAPEGYQSLVLSALRKDTLTKIADVFDSLKVKVKTVDIHELDTLRALAGTGVLDSLVGQLGTEARWGALFLESGRARLSVWQGSSLIVIHQADLNDPLDKYGMMLNPMQLEDIAQALAAFMEQVLCDFWFVHGISEESIEMLSERLRLPMRAAFWPESFSVAPLLDGGNLRIETLGCALRDWVSFPFELQFASLHKRLFKSSRGVLGFLSPKAAASTSHRVDTENERSKTGLLMTFLIAGLVVIGLATTSLYILSFLAKSEQGKLTASVEQSQASINVLKQQLAKVQSKNTVQKRLRDLIVKTKHKNQLYSEIGHDLKEFVPESLWLESTSIGESLTLRGKAIHHQDVLLFARRFDDATYLNSMLIQKIKETTLQNNNVFSFEIKADIQLAKEPETANAQLTLDTEEGSP